MKAAGPSERKKAKGGGLKDSHFSLIHTFFLLCIILYIMYICTCMYVHVCMYVCTC